MTAKNKDSKYPLSLPTRLYTLGASAIADKYQTDIPIFKIKEVMRPSVSDNASYIKRLLNRPGSRLILAYKVTWLQVNGDFKTKEFNFSTLYLPDLDKCVQIKHKEFHMVEEITRADIYNMVRQPLTKIAPESVLIPMKAHIKRRAANTIKTLLKKK